MVCNTSAIAFTPIHPVQWLLILEALSDNSVRCEALNQSECQKLTEYLSGVLDAKNTIEDFYVRRKIETTSIETLHRVMLLDSNYGIDTTFFVGICHEVVTGDTAI